MVKFRLNDWNDIKLLIACADQGGFAAAAKVLGMDQITVSRRIGHMEAAVGRPLFNRKNSGASPTAAGQALLERARALEHAIHGFEGAMLGLTSSIPAPVVTISASEGVLAYLVIPALLGSTASEIPLDRSLLRGAPPQLTFTGPGNRADIAVIATNPGDVPNGPSTLKGRKVGTMNFVPVASRKYLEKRSDISRFDDLRDHPVMDNQIYHGIRAMDEWNHLISSLKEGPVLVATNTSSVQKPLVAGAGVTLLPPYSTLYDHRVVVLDIPSPHLAVDLWMVSHEDTLREPVIRELYDSLAEMFLRSRWFRN